eukprot:gnl/Hemi2/19249_TR6386_c0_g1_i1.p1 gnl/Hemi2/19249_TR6386_c0_g1~~gnl/Hemi2/19249_TR6386_c0_g1_i1.p1  ORF type:complete len:436 (+),score=52.91 gnl/Hemi2/19249_TR6386_c0_g1_i1:50-1357(+)
MLFCANCRHPLEIEEDTVVVPDPPGGISVPVKSQSANAAGSRNSRAFDVDPKDRLEESFVLLPRDSQSLEGLAQAQALKTAPAGMSLPTPNSSRAETFDSSGLTAMSSQFSIITKLCECATEQSKIDFPLCIDCSEKIGAEGERLRAEAEKEFTICQRLLGQLMAEDAKVDEESYQREIGQLEQSEKELMTELRTLEQEWSAVKAEKARLEGESNHLDVLEQQYWDDYNEYESRLLTYQRERDAMRQKIEHTNSELERLSKANVYNDAFHIWHDGHCGSINNFRLGRLPSQSVEWDEINAALGQVVLCLDVMAKRRNYTFKQYQLHPMGSCSKISKRSRAGRICDLYGQNDLQSRTVPCARFDKGMVWLLACVSELAAHAQETERDFALPYPIQHDTLAGVSAKLSGGFQSWSQAMKWMLSDIKWIIAWMARVQP